eukprot:jgi/Bigna1/128473/aug1.6_g3181
MINKLIHRCSLLLAINVLWISEVKCYKSETNSVGARSLAQLLDIKSFSSVDVPIRVRVFPLGISEKDLNTSGVISSLRQSLQQILPQRVQQSSSPYGEVARRVVDIPYLSHFSKSQSRGTFSTSNSVENPSYTLDVSVIDSTRSDELAGLYTVLKGSVITRKAGSTNIEQQKTLIDSGPVIKYLRKIVAWHADIDHNKQQLQVFNIFILNPNPRAMVLPSTAEYGYVADTTTTTKAFSTVSSADSHISNFVPGTSPSSSSRASSSYNLNHLFASDSVIEEYESPNEEEERITLELHKKLCTDDDDDDDDDDDGKLPMKGSERQLSATERQQQQQQQQQQHRPYRTHSSNSVTDANKLANSLAYRIADAVYRVIIPPTAPVALRFSEKITIELYVLTTHSSYKPFDKTTMDYFRRFLMEFQAVGQELSISPHHIFIQDDLELATAFSQSLKTLTTATAAAAATAVSSAQQADFFFETFKYYFKHFVLCEIQSQKKKIFIISSGQLIEKLSSFHEHVIHDHFAIIEDRWDDHDDDVSNQNSKLRQTSQSIPVFVVSVGTDTPILVDGQHLSRVVGSMVVAVQNKQQDGSLQGAALDPMNSILTDIMILTSGSSGPHLGRLSHKDNNDDDDDDDGKGQSNMFKDTINRFHALSITTAALKTANKAIKYLSSISESPLRVEILHSSPKHKTVGTGTTNIEAISSHYKALYQNLNSISNKLAKSSWIEALERAVLLYDTARDFLDVILVFTEEVQGVAHSSRVDISPQYHFEHLFRENLESLGNAADWALALVAIVVTLLVNIPRSSHAVVAKVKVN